MPSGHFNQRKVWASSSVVSVPDGRSGNLSVSASPIHTLVAGKFSPSST